MFTRIVLTGDTHKRSVYVPGPLTASDQLESFGKGGLSNTGYSRQVKRLIREDPIYGILVCAFAGIDIVDLVGKNPEKLEGILGHADVTEALRLKVGKLNISKINSIKAGIYAVLERIQIRLPNGKIAHTFDSADYLEALQIASHTFTSSSKYEMDAQSLVTAEQKFRFVEKPLRGKPVVVFKGLSEMAQGLQDVKNMSEDARNLYVLENFGNLCTTKMVTAFFKTE